MIKFKDQIGREISIPDLPKRIICLVPSITELLYYLELEDRIVGRTKFCVFPENKVKKAQKIGGTKTISIEKIELLKPDLIIANKEENTKEIIESLESDFPVYVSNVQTIHSALDMILDIGKMTKTHEKAGNLVDEIENRREIWHRKNYKNKRVLYLIWKNPYMTIGRDTFIYHMMHELNLDSILYDFRYPEITEAYIKEEKPEFLLLSSEPYPFKEKDLKEMNSKFPDSKSILVDGTYFSWYGNRILDAYDYFETIMNKNLDN